jgi:hypothetical protein
MPMGEVGLEPTSLAAADFKSAVFAISPLARLLSRLYHLPAGLAKPPSATERDGDLKRWIGDRNGGVYREEDTP